MLKIFIPIKLPSILNARLHWRVLDKIKQGQKAATKICLHGHTLPPLPATVTIIRVGPRKLDDDNLQGAGKYVRDEIARAYGVDDGSDQYTWKYEQRKENGYSVEIWIESQPRKGKHGE